MVEREGFEPSSCFVTTHLKRVEYEERFSSDSFIEKLYKLVYPNLIIFQWMDKPSLLLFNRHYLEYLRHYYTPYTPLIKF